MRQPWPLQKVAKTVTDLLESYRKLFLPTKTNNEWLKTNTKVYIVESKSAIPEVRAKQESATPDSKYTWESMTVLRRQVGN